MILRKEGELVVIDDFDVMGFVSVPGKANPPLQIDADTEWPPPVSPQGFKVIAGISHQVLKAGRGIQNIETSQSLAMNGLKAANRFALPERLAVPAAK